MRAGGDVRWIMRTARASVLAVGFAACNPKSGDPPAATLDCAWLASDNCWKKTIAAATSCLPDSAAVGTLSADGKTCTFASGQTVTFDPPVLPATLTLMSKVSFTMSANGAPCVSFRWTDANSFAVSTSAGTVTSSTSAPVTETIQCPDGSQFSNANALSLFSCDAGDSIPPGESTSWSDTSITIEAIGTASPGDVQIFTCQM